jgi:hypothetical protein
MLRSDHLVGLADDSEAIEASWWRRVTGLVIRTGESVRARDEDGEHTDDFQAQDSRC